MEEGTKVKFIKDVPTWNGKSRRAKAGDTGYVFWVSHDGSITVRRDGKANMVHDVHPSALEVIS